MNPGGSPPDEAGPNMNIREFAKHTGLTAHTLRYYERRNFTERVLPPPVLTPGTYADKPAARPDDWSGLQLPLAEDARTKGAHAMGYGDDGGPQVKPELDLPPAAPHFDVGDLLGIDEEDDGVPLVLPSASAPSGPQGRTARLAALDPDDGMAL